jgi:hypothetical protein
MEHLGGQGRKGFSDSEIGSMMDSGDTLLPQEPPAIPATTEQRPRLRRSNR